jgi:hypothetical protein
LAGASTETTNSSSEAERFLDLGEKSGARRRGERGKIYCG